MVQQNLPLPNLKIRQKYFFRKIAEELAQNLALRDCLKCKKNRPYIRLSLFHGSPAIVCVINSHVVESIITYILGREQVIMMCENHRAALLQFWLKEERFRGQDQ